MIKQQLSNLSLFLFRKKYYLLNFILFYLKNNTKIYINIFFNKYVINDFIVSKHKSREKLIKTDITLPNSYYCDSEKKLDKTQLKKVYLMSSKYQYDDGTKIDFDILKTYINTSIRSGIHLRYYIFSLTESNFIIDTNKIESELNDFSPEYLIMLDAWFFINNQNEKEKRIEFINKMKIKYNFKLIVLIPDPHVSNPEKNVFNYLTITDKLISMSSWSPLFEIKSIKCKLQNIPYFVDEDLFYPTEKNIDLFFSGAVQPGRLQILSVAGYYSNKYGLNAKINLFIKNSKIYKPLDTNTYTDYIRRARSVINVGMKGTRVNGKNIHTINGRVADAIACGALLIQYQPYNDDTLTLHEYYTPGLDYLTFSNRKQLHDIFILLKNDIDTINRISLNGRRKYLQKYNSLKGWESLLSFNSLVPS